MNPSLPLPTRPVEDVVRQARKMLADALRDKVAGDDAQERARAIWHSEGQRWFTAKDPIWRVHADASMFVGGIRALLLQSLHPLAMAGVAGHSGYRSDPWGRLQRTSHFLATTTFGTVEAAEDVIASVRTIHERVRGRTQDGRPYAASDPHLLAWVHVAEVDSFLTAYQRYAPEPLGDGEADRYVAQAAGTATRLGVLDAPTSVAALGDALDSYRPELESTPAAREAARFLLLHPPLELSARPGYAALGAAAVALMPSWSRPMLGLPWLPITERVVSLPLGAAATAAVRWALSDPDDARNPRSGRHPA